MDQEVDLSVFSAQSPAHNDFRSDTFTSPTVSMITSLGKASLGDAVYNEDKVTIELEQKVADLAGKEAGLYCVSGTMSNQLGLRVNLHQPPYNVMCDKRSHVYSCEAGGIATLSQAMTQSILPKNGLYLTLEDDIKPNFIPDDGEIHHAPTKVISLENTLYGILYPIDEIAKISHFCRENGVRLHLDGARLWNASAASGISIKKYASYFDSVSLCLSKSLGAPIGSVLVADKKFIAKANHFKKQVGGGIRQSGLLAAMAITAIDENVPVLKNTHQMAQEISEFCKSHGIALMYPPDTNFVFIDLSQSYFDPKIVDEILAINNLKLTLPRIAIHYQISQESLQRCKKVILDSFKASQATKPATLSQPSSVY